MAKTIIRLPEVRRLTGKPTTTIYREIAQGRFPRQVPIGIRAVGWIKEEIDAYNDAVAARRDGAAQ